MSVSYLIFAANQDILHISPDNCMSRYRKFFNKAIASLLIFLLVSLNNSVLAADGEALFKANCANCHKPDADYTGPALKGWKDRIPSPEIGRASCRERV